MGSTIIALVQGFSVFLKGNWAVSDFVASYVGIPIFIVPIIVWKLWHKTKVSRLVLMSSTDVLTPTVHSSS